MNFAHKKTSSLNGTKLSPRYHPN